MGWTDPVDMVFIDGMPVAEYVRKYSPENANNKDYQKAQVMAALTSGRHHVDVALLRTRSDGTFQVSAVELTMDLSDLDGEERRFESTRENRRKSLIKDEDARIARQLAIEDKVLKTANRVANRKVEELIPADQVRNEVFAAIPYGTLYGKSPKEVEQILDREIDRRERERLKEALRPQMEKEAFASAKKAIGNAPANRPGPAAEAVAGEGNFREQISLEALNLDIPARRPAGHRNQQAPQNQHAPQNPQVGNQPQNQRAGNQPQNPQAGNQPQNQQVQRNQPQNQQAENHNAGPGRKRRNSMG